MSAVLRSLLVFSDVTGAVLSVCTDAIRSTLGNMKLLERPWRHYDRNLLCLTVITFMTDRDRVVAHSYICFANCKVAKAAWIRLHTN